MAAQEPPSRRARKKRRSPEQIAARRARVKSLERNGVLRAIFTLLTLGRLKKWERKVVHMSAQNLELADLQSAFTDLQGRMHDLEAVLQAERALHHEEMGHLEDARARVDELTEVLDHHASSARSLAGFVQHLEQGIFRTDGLTDAGQKTVQAIEAGLSGEDAWQTLTVMSADRHGTPGFRSIVPYMAPRRAVPAAVKEALQAEREQLNVIDIGSEVLAWEDDVYAPLARSFPCDVTGFDPFADREAVLKRSDGRFVRTLPYLIGDGAAKTFHSNRSSATSSTLPRGTVTEAIPLLHLSLETQETREMPSYRLDELRGKSIPDGDIDLLKIDVQGAAFEVLEHSPEVLKKTLAVHVEVEFTQVYEQQKLFADVDRELRKNGFAMIDFLDIGRMNYGALSRDPERFFMYGRALWADVVYLAGYDDGRAMKPDQLLSQAVVMHEMYNKQDVAAELLSRYDEMTENNILSHYNEP